MVAALPAAWIARKVIKPAKSRLKARPRLATRYITKVPMKVILRPRVSLRGPHTDGASPCTIMYTVTVRDTSEMSI